MLHEVLGRGRQTFIGFSRCGPRWKQIGVRLSGIFCSDTEGERIDVGRHQLVDVETLSSMTYCGVSCGSHLKTQDKRECEQREAKPLLVECCGVSLGVQVGARHCDSGTYCPSVL